MPLHLVRDHVDDVRAATGRLVPGGPYSKANVVPSCGRCNIARNLFNIPDGCEYGPVGSDTLADLGGVS